MPSDLQITNIKDQANANSAITIASDGQITVNQDNPTVTLGSNATFPTGTILQVNQAVTTTTVQDGSKGANIAVTALEVSFTTKVANGKYLVTCYSPNTNSNHAGNTMKGHFAVNENNAGYSNQTAATYVRNGRAYSDYGYQNLFFQVLYTASTSSGQNIKFRPMYEYASGGGTDTIFYHSDTAGKATFTIMEIVP